MDNRLMQSKMLLSVIIPAYNVEKYLDECLESCFRQDLGITDYEIILVNDGSTDRTLEIAEKWVASHSNIKLISQHNKGLSEARNAGMSIAEGTYMMFIDSDDYIEENCLRRLLNAGMDSDADMIRIGACKEVDGKDVTIVSHKDYGKVQSGKLLLKEKINASANLAIYKTTFLKGNNLTFFPDIYHEDNDFTPRAYYMAERVLTVRDIIYHVRQTPGSITRTVNPKRIHDLIGVVGRLLDFAGSVPDDRYRSGIYYQAARSLNWCIKESRRLDDATRKEIWRNLSHNSFYFRQIIKSPSLLHKTEGVIMTSFFMARPVKTLRRFKESVHEILEKATVSIFGETTAGYKTVYFLRTRKCLDMHNPRNLNEKLFWLARYWRNPLMTQCADKYLVREYLTEKGCGDILNDLYGVYEKAADIPFDSLPPKFVLKCNHGSHMNIICEDKTVLDREAAVRQIDRWMKETYGRGYEWQYKPIPRKIIAEKYIESKDGRMTEYQIFCFNGKPQFFLVRNDLRNSSADKATEQFAVSYTMDWQRVYMRKGEEQFKIEPPKPANYQKMIDYAIRLSADFPQVRVDYYEVDDRLIFGELTFSSNGNVQSNYRKEYIESLGKKLLLPEPYHDRDFLK